MILSTAPLALPWWAYLSLLTVTLTLAVLRMTRFVTTDALGDWWFVQPAERWAARHEDNNRKATIVTIQEMQGKPMTVGATMFIQDKVDQLEQDDPMSWQARLVSGLSCPFCVGFHLTWAMIVLTLLTVTVPVLSIIWHVILAALAVNYVTAHISAKLD